MNKIEELSKQYNKVLGIKGELISKINKLFEELDSLINQITQTDWRHLPREERGELIAKRFRITKIMILEMR